MSVFTNSYNAGIVFVDGTELGSTTGPGIPLGLNNAFNDALSLSQTSAQTVVGPLSLTGALTCNGTLIHTSGEQQKVTVFTSAGNYTVLGTDRYVIITKVTGAATTVTLPAAPPNGRIITIKDGKGDAGTNNITVIATQNIDNVVGATGIVLNINFASVDLIFNSSSNVWNVV